MSRLVGLVLLVACFYGCGKEGQLTDPIVWPNRAYVGETVAMAIDSNYVPYAEFAESHEASTDNVVIELRETTPVDPNNPISAVVPVRGIVTGGAGRSSEFAARYPGAEVTVVIFDVPASSLFPYPAFPTTVSVKPLIMGLDRQTFDDAGELEVLGDATGGAGPLVFFPGPNDGYPGTLLGATLEELLAPRPALRLRALRGQLPALEGVPIGSLEFELVFPPALVADPDPVPTSEAVGATVSVGSLAPDRVKVVLVHAGGFQLPHVGAVAGEEMLGQGPFLDIAFEKLAAFAEPDFRIDNLYVTDLDGTALVDERGLPGSPTDSTARLKLYARANQ